MKAKLLFAICSLAASINAAAVTIELDKVSADPTRKIVLQDKRAAEEKVHHRDGVRSPIQYFGDKDFNTPPLDQFSLLLGSHLAPGEYAIEVNKFRVIDVFPQRLSAGTAGAMMGVLGSMGYAAYFAGEESTTQDNITCLVSGNLSSKPVDASVSVPYKMSAMAMLVKKDPAFKKAVNDCLGQLAEKIAKSP